MATYSIKHKQDVIEDYEIKMEESITITRKEASSQLDRNVAIIYQPALAAVSSTICSQVLVQTKHFVPYLQHLIPTIGRCVYLLFFTSHSM